MGISYGQSQVPIIFWTLIFAQDGGDGFAAIIDEREEFGRIQSLFRDAETNINEIERFYEIL